MARPVMSTQRALAALLMSSGVMARLAQAAHDADAPAAPTQPETPPPPEDDRA